MTKEARQPRKEKVYYQEQDAIHLDPLRAAAAYYLHLVNAAGGSGPEPADRPVVKRRKRDPNTAPTANFDTLAALDGQLQMQPGYQAAIYAALFQYLAMMPMYPQPLAGMMAPGPATAYGIQCAPSGVAAAPMAEGIAQQSVLPGAMAAPGTGDGSDVLKNARQTQ